MKDLDDFLLIQHVDSVLNIYIHVHGPWPLHAYPNSNSFTRALYRILNRRHEVPRNPEDLFTEGILNYDDIGRNYDDFCSTDLDPEM